MGRRKPVSSAVLAPFRPDRPGRRDPPERRPLARSYSTLAAVPATIDLVPMRPFPGPGKAPDEA